PVDPVAPSTALCGPELGPYFPRRRLPGHERAALPAARRLRALATCADRTRPARDESCDGRTVRRVLEVAEVNYFIGATGASNCNDSSTSLTRVGSLRRKLAA